MRPSPKIFVLFGIVSALATAFFFGLFDGISLEALKEQQDFFRHKASTEPMEFGSLFFLLYVIVTALSLPGAAVLTLAGGAIFGFSRGLLLVSFASSIGASFAFLLSRYLFRDWAEKKFGEKFSQIQNGFEKDGIFYLVFLRLVPAFPFFLVNILTGLTQISLLKFYFFSQLAMLPGTAVFVNAGTELSQVRSLSDVLSPRLLVAFSLLGIFPIASKKIMNFWRERHVS